MFLFGSGLRTNRKITTEYRKYEGLVYEAKIVPGFTNVLAMEVALAVGEEASGNGISFPLKQWSRLPRSDRYLT